MIAFAMNDEQLPLVNGVPLRLVVPGWYATYWVKMLNDIEVLDQPDTNYWTNVAYTIPDITRQHQVGRNEPEDDSDQSNGAQIL
jgi:DMSO/TMAO reductase YedYZ molybdopterin-dependent catalytic subunit